MLGTKQNYQKLKLDDFNPIRDYNKLSREKFNENKLMFAEKFGFYLNYYFMNREQNRLLKKSKNALSTSQIRNFYGEVRNLQTILSLHENMSDDEFNDKILKRVLLLRPRLAYSAARTAKNNNKHRIIDFQAIMDLEISKIINAENKRKQFEEFMDFFEAILAYHKAYGGTEN